MSSPKLYRKSSGLLISFTVEQNQESNPQNKQHIPPQQQQKQPTNQPTNLPTEQPANQPASQPTNQPNERKHDYQCLWRRTVPLTPLNKSSGSQPKLHFVADDKKGIERAFIVSRVSRTILIVRRILFDPVTKVKLNR